MAGELVDTKLLAKLSEGDMIATEVKYHRNCCTRSNNAYHGHNAKKYAENSARDVTQGTFYYLIHKMFCKL